MTILLALFSSSAYYMVLNNFAWKASYAGQCGSRYLGESPLIIYVGNRTIASKLQVIQNNLKKSDTLKPFSTNLARRGHLDLGKQNAGYVPPGRSGDTEAF